MHLVNNLMIGWGLAKGTHKQKGKQQTMWTFVEGRYKGKWEEFEKKKIQFKQVFD